MPAYGAKNNTACLAPKIISSPYSFLSSAKGCLHPDSGNTTPAKCRELFGRLGIFRAAVFVPVSLVIARARFPDCSLARALDHRLGSGRTDQLPVAHAAVPACRAGRRRARTGEFPHRFVALGLVKVGIGAIERLAGHWRQHDGRLCSCCLGGSLVGSVAEQARQHARQNGQPARPTVNFHGNFPQKKKRPATSKGRGRLQTFSVRRLRATSGSILFCQLSQGTGVKRSGRLNQAAPKHRVLARRSQVTRRVA